MHLLKPYCRDNTHGLGYMKRIEFYGHSLNELRGIYITCLDSLYMWHRVIISSSWLIERLIEISYVNM